MRGYSRNPESLLFYGLICSGYGIYLFKRALDGDTLLPGTTFTYIPKWLFYSAAILLQAPLPLAYFFLKSKNLI